MSFTSISRMRSRSNKCCRTAFGRACQWIRGIYEPNSSREISPRRRSTSAGSFISWNRSTFVLNSSRYKSARTSIKRSAAEERSACASRAFNCSRTSYRAKRWPRRSNSRSSSSSTRLLSGGESENEHAHSRPSSIRSLIERSPGLSGSHGSQSRDLRGCGGTVRRPG